MNKLEVLLNQLEAKIPFAEKVNQEVSHSSVGWQIEHILLTLNAIIHAVSKSNPAEYKWSFNFMRMLIFNLKKIPRGKAKAPAVVQPKGAFDQEHLMKHVSIARKKVEDLYTLSNDKYFSHPIFGNLQLKQTINFLEIHTQHHLKIIEDILKK